MASAYDARHRRRGRATAFPPRRPWALTFGLAAASLGLAGCGTVPSVLDPRSPAAETIADLWWVMFGLGALVMVGFTAFLALAIWRRRGTDGDPGPRAGRTVIILAGAAIPAIILVTLMVVVMNTAMALDIPPSADQLTVEVTGHQFWWEATYPQHGFTTANEIHIPAGQPSLFLLTTADVIHSFWVPQLQGKTDMIPGQTNRTWLTAEEPGTYLGQCAEYCGVQHGYMRLIVFADEPGEFQAWLEGQAQPARAPSDGLAREGMDVFLSQPCRTCHTIRGIEGAVGRLGPDLTHLASRRTIGARLLDNNVGNLGGWVVDAQNLKPGCLMPPVYMSGPELQALLAFLMSLE